MRNFYLKPEKWQEPYTITGQEATHISKVLRMKSGERIQLLDGNGRTGEFEITQVKSGSIICQPVHITQHPLPARRCWLAPAYTKAARRGFLLEKSVELDAGGLWFWQAEFSQAKVPPDAKEKWQAELVAGAKQSSNPWLPEIKTFPSGAEELAASGKRFKQRFLLWEDAGQEQMLLPEDLQGSVNAPKTLHDSIDAPENLQRSIKITEDLQSNVRTPEDLQGNANILGDILFVMGPEGGLSKQEVDIFIQNGFKPVSLGRRILRWETAAVLCLGLSWWINEINFSLNGK